MIWVGLDLHKKYITACAMDEAGGLVMEHQRLPTAKPASTEGVDAPTAGPEPTSSHPAPTPCDEPHSSPIGVALLLR